MILSSCAGNQPQANGEAHDVIGNGDASPPANKKVKKSISSLLLLVQAIPLFTKKHL